MDDFICYKESLRVLYSVFTFSPVVGFNLRL